MANPLRQKIEAAISRHQALLAETQLALTGDRDFGVEQVRVLSASIHEMAPLMARARELLTQAPEFVALLDRYKSQLRELQTTLDRINLMLLTKRSQMRTHRGQLEAVSQWAGALQQTR